jgi:hypothetical protein
MIVGFNRGWFCPAWGHLSMSRDTATMDSQDATKLPTTLRTALQKGYPAQNASSANFEELQVRKTTKNIDRDIVENSLGRDFLIWIYNISVFTRRSLAGS